MSLAADFENTSPRRRRFFFSRSIPALTSATRRLLSRSNQSSIIALSARFGTTRLRLSRCFVLGSAWLCSNHRVSAARSYVMPAGVVAGSRMTHKVMGHRKFAGAESSSSHSGITNGPGQCARERATEEGGVEGGGLGAAAAAA